jgi:DNA-binding transcriptional regulator YiaG
MATQIQNMRGAGRTESARRSSGETSCLSDWKSIAKYLGKGVRTVQRWEVELGLPVRRIHPGRPKAGVMAVRSEIDAWVKTLPLATDWRAREKSERDELLQTIAELRLEIRELRKQLEMRNS